MHIDQRQAWNQVSELYQANQQISTDSVYYGPWSPPESELKLLGDLHGKRVLEVGCGGGQSSVALARQGAIVTAVDVSDAQLDFARQLASNQNLGVEFIQSDVESLHTFKPCAWEVVLACNLFQYIADIASTLQQCNRLLRVGGRLVISLDHPLRSCFIDEEEDELALFPIRNYFDETPLRWRFSGSQTWMVSYHRTVAQWVDLLQASGFHLLRLVEPPLVAEMADALWPIDGPLATLRNIPQTLIFIVEKR